MTHGSSHQPLPHRPRRQRGAPTRRNAAAPAAPRPRALTSLAALKPPAQARLNSGVLVLARIPFRDGGSKVRPAVVHSVHGDRIRVLPITSSSRSHYLTGWLRLTDWVAAGLDRPSSVRCNEPCTVDRRFDVIDVIGTLATRDRELLDARVAA